MIASAVVEAQCGRFTIVGGPIAPITWDGRSVVILAEREYTVRLPIDAPIPLNGALSVLPGATEGRLRFGNFVGRTELDGTTIDVRSSRASPGEVAEMLDAVMAALGSLPTAAASPVGINYDRGAWFGADVDYQAYVAIRDAIVGRRPHDLTSAMERILARPHERLTPEERTVVLAQADRLDRHTIVGILSRRHLLVPVPEHHPLADRPLTVAMGGLLPARVRIRRPTHTTDTLENRFVCTVLEMCLATVRVVQRAAASAASPASAGLLKEAGELATILERWTHSRPLADLEPSPAVPTTSTVLRGRVGYRDVLAFFADLVSRTQRIPPRDAHRLVGLRDAATIYEYWCYFTFVDALSSVLEEEATIEITPHEWFGPIVQRQSQATFPSGTRVLYNQTFSRTSASYRSYSVVFRPDITLELPSGERHLFDAKFAFEPGSPASDERDDDDDVPAANPSRARRAHLHKMHAYRDATGARSVWVLYPGRAYEQFQAPSEDGVGGIGAIPLRLDSIDGHRALRRRLGQIVPVLPDL